MEGGAGHDRVVGREQVHLGHGWRAGGVGGDPLGVAGGQGKGADDGGGAVRPFDLAGECAVQGGPDACGEVVGVHRHVHPVRPTRVGEDAPDVLPVGGEVGGDE